MHHCNGQRVGSREKKTIKTKPKLICPGKLSKKFSFFLGKSTKKSKTNHANTPCR